MSDVSLLTPTSLANYLAALHGLILALIVWRKRHFPGDANTLLALLLGLSSYLLAGATFYNGGGYLLRPHAVVLFDPLVLLFPPLLYLYVQTRIQGSLSWNWRQVVHLLPFGFNLFILMPFYLLPAEGKITYFMAHLRHPHPLSLVLAPRILIPICYMIMSLVVLFRHARTVPRSINTVHTRNLLWLWHLLIGILLVWGVICLVHLYIPIRISEEEFSHLSNLLSALFIFALGYRVLLHPEILHRELTGAEPPKYEKSGITQDGVDLIWKRLEDDMVFQKPFLDPALTLKTLADHLQVPPHQLSQVINQRSGERFNPFLNRHRVRHAMHMMAQQPESKILTIAFASGFQSLSTFNRVFREQTGMSPAQYRNTLMSPSI